MKANFQNKVVIISGSSQGIGKQLAFDLLKRKANVIINGRDKVKLGNVENEFISKGYNPLCIEGDITNYSDCEKIVNESILKYGKIDILINNAAMSLCGTIEDSTPAIIQKIIDINLTGNIYMTKAAIPFLKKTGGTIVFNSSIAAFMGLPEYSIYCSTKSALSNITDSLRLELKKYNIKISIVFIGFTITEKTKTYYNSKGELEILLSRKNITLMTQESVSAKIISSISKNKNTTVLTRLGKLIFILKRYFPGILDFLIYKSMR